jgi:hypothetical protein
MQFTAGRRKIRRKVPISRRWERFAGAMKKALEINMSVRINVSWNENS